MRKLKLHISQTPIHVMIMFMTAFISLVSIFVPVFELFALYQKRGTFSLFSLMMTPQLQIKLTGLSANINVQPLATIMFIAAVAASLMALALAVYVSRSSCPPKRKRLGCLIVLLLLISRIVIQLKSLSGFVSEDYIKASGIDPRTLFVSQATVGNIFIIVFFIGIVASLYGALGLKMHMKKLAYPYFAWVIIFTILPLLLIFFRAFFATKQGGGYEFTLAGFNKLFENKTVTTTFYGFKVTLQEYFSVFVRSLDYAVWTTIGCLIIGYPLAYIMANRTKKFHKTSSKLLLFIVLPMWMNTMLRTYAWRAFFSQTGVLNNFLLDIGLISSPIDFLKNAVLSDIITKLVMVNDFLPFMILPMYSVLVKIDSSLAQAAADLGANRRQTFTKVIFPLSLPGVISGIQMVFMPSLTFYMIPDIISEGSKTTIGNTVQSFILNESTTAQQAGNVLSLLLLIFVLITMGILRNQDKEASGNGGMAL